jgi:hypothetical protein
MDARKRELGLRLNSVSPKNPHACGLLARMGEQGRLTDSGLSAEDEGSARSAAGFLQQPLDQVALDCPSKEHLPIVRDRRPQPRLCLTKGQGHRNSNP